MSWACRVDLPELFVFQLVVSYIHLSAVHTASEAARWWSSGAAQDPNEDHNQWGDWSDRGKNKEDKQWGKQTWADDKSPQSLALTHFVRNNLLVLCRR